MKALGDIDFPHYDLDVAAAAVYEVVSTCTTALSDLSVPVLAVLQGDVSGVGFALALAADWRICSSDARLTCESSDLYRIEEAVSRVVGPRHDAKTVASLLTSTIGPEQAVNVGLASSIHNSLDEATSAAMSLANEIASTSSHATRNAMRLLRPQNQADSVMTACDLYIYIYIYI